MSSLLHKLPTELLHDIIELLDKPALSQLNRTSRWAYELATPLIWRDVLLTDCATDTQFDGVDCVDYHDDTPMLRKLIVLVQQVLQMP